MSNRSRHPLAATALVACALAVSACSDGGLGPGDDLTAGTWGGNDVGLIVSATGAHVHFGCTSGDFPAPIVLDEGRGFTVAGEYDPVVSPVGGGPRMPAELSGLVHGRELTMTVTVQDTIEDRQVVFGPATVRLGREPDMQMCPICEVLPGGA